MDIVMNYLREAKAAAQLRTTNYSSTEKKNKSGGTSSSNSSFRGGRGRGGGYDGKKNFSNRGRGRGGYKGRVRTDNSTCILCEEQHFLPHCPKWQDQTTDKRFLYGFVISSKPMCTYCLRTGHEFSNCQSKNPALGCPCGSGINKSKSS